MGSHTNKQFTHLELFADWNTMIKSKAVFLNLTCFVNYPFPNPLPVHYFLTESAIMIQHVSDDGTQLQHREL